MTVYSRPSQGIHGGGDGERKRYKAVKRMEVHHICIYEYSIMKPTKRCLKGQGTGVEIGNIMKGTNLFKVHCKLKWNYHNEIPLYY
jgi:hypothetical protein